MGNANGESGQKEYSNQELFAAWPALVLGNLEIGCTVSPFEGTQLVTAANIQRALRTRQQALLGSSGVSSATIEQFGDEQEASPILTHKINNSILEKLVKQMKGCGMRLK